MSFYFVRKFLLCAGFVHELSHERVKHRIGLDKNPLDKIVFPFPHECASIGEIRATYLKSMTRNIEPETLNFCLFRTFDLQEKTP